VHPPGCQPGSRGVMAVEQQVAGAGDIGPVEFVGAQGRAMPILQAGKGTLAAGLVHADEDHVALWARSAHQA